MVSSEEELARRFTWLLDHPQNMSESAFVQALVADPDVEVRTFVVRGEPVGRVRRYARYAPPARTDEEGEWTRRGVGIFAGF